MLSMTVSVSEQFVVAPLPRSALLLATLEAPPIATGFVRTLHVAFYVSRHLEVTWTRDRLRCPFLSDDDPELLGGRR